MLNIRLQRRGRTNDPSFRVIVVDSKEPAKTGKYAELVGSYDARTDRIELKADRIKHWIAHGAQPSDTVHNMLLSQGIIEGKKINVLPRKSPPKVEVEEKPAEAPAAAEAPIEVPEAPVAEESSPAEEPTPANESAPAETEPEDVSNTVAQEEPAE